MAKLESEWFGILNNIGESTLNFLKYNQPQNTR